MQEETAMDEDLPFDPARAKNDIIGILPILSQVSPSPQDILLANNLI